MKLRQMILSSLLIAMGTLLSQWVKFPVGPALCAPIQHLINVLGAVLLGPVYAVVNAFIISLLRNLMGSGTLLAFPGSMIGALLAGLMYRLWPKTGVAAVGEVIGTGILGSLVAFPVAKFILGKSVGALFFIPSFVISSAVGAGIAIVILPALKGVHTMSWSSEK